MQPRKIMAATRTTIQSECVRKLDQLIPAVADEDVRRIHPEVSGYRIARRRRARARIEAERIVGRCLDRFEHLRRRGQWRFVGVELDPALAVGRLLARNVGLETVEALPYEAFRHSSKNVSRASRGLTFCS